MALADIDRKERPYLGIAESDEQRTRTARQGSAHQRHQFLPRPQSLRRPRRDNRARSGPRSSARPAVAHLDRRLQHGRGNLLAGHAVSRAIRQRNATSSCRYSPPISMPSHCQAREGATRKRSRPRYRRSGWRASSPGGTGYRVSAELRAEVVFTVQDVLADPPFSRLDLVSCRNLLIYLGPEAQAKVICPLSFRAARGRHPPARRRRDGRQPQGRFEVVSKAERLYRTIGRSRLPSLACEEHAESADAIARPADQAPSPGGARRSMPRLVLETYAPAAVLINRKHECLYSRGRPIGTCAWRKAIRPKICWPWRAGEMRQAQVGDSSGQPGNGTIVVRRRSVRS